MKTFNEYIEAMLLYKESIGYSRKSYEYDLMRFCNYIVTKQLDVSDLKEEIVLSWCSRWESESQTSARRRIQSVRELLKYLSAIGIDCYVIPSSFLPRAETRTPYIFTDKELQSIFKECDDLLPNKCSPNRHLILPVLLRLIFLWLASERGTGTAKLRHRFRQRHLACPKKQISQRALCRHVR